LVQLAVAVPVVGPVMSLSAALVPLAPPAYDASHVDAPCDHVTFCAVQGACVGGGGAAVLHSGADTVTVPLLHAAVAVPVVGAVMSLSAALVPLAPPPYDALHVENGVRSPGSNSQK
jgi:hypothetical protein